MVENMMDNGLIISKINLYLNLFFNFIFWLFHLLACMEKEFIYGKMEENMMENI